MRALALGIVKIEAHAAGGRVVFAPQPKVNPSNVVALVQSQPETYAFGGADSLRFKCDLSDEQQRFEFVEELLTTLGADAVELQGVAV